MAKIKEFTDLIVWQKGHELVLTTYQLTKKFPSDEKFALNSQMRRASVSITSNVAEGFGRRGAKDKEHFYVMASGSITELQNQFIIARDLTYMTDEEYTKVNILLKDVKLLLNALLKTHRSNFKS